MTVWVLTYGEYEDHVVLDVYASAELAMAAWDAEHPQKMPGIRVDWRREPLPSPQSNWTQDAHGTWDNGLSAVVTSYEVIEAAELVNQQ